MMIYINNYIINGKLNLKGSKIGSQGAKDLADQLIDSNVTRVIGIKDKHLSTILTNNLNRKKSRVIALAQALDATIIPEEIGSSILSYTHEAYVSGQSKTTKHSFKDGGSLANTLFGKVLTRNDDKKENTHTTVLKP